MSATIRATVYLLALSHREAQGRLSIVLVEMLYVTLTAGLYAGLQQRALRIRPHLLGNLIIVAAVPALAQLFDALAHRVLGAVVPVHAFLGVCLFAAVSALFHLHVMRNGVFLTGCHGRSLPDDFRRIPALLAAFLLKPVALSARLTRTAPFEASL